MAASADTGNGMITKSESNVFVSSEPGASFRN